MEPQAGRKVSVACILTERDQGQDCFGIFFSLISRILNMFIP